MEKGTERAPKRLRVDFALMGILFTHHVDGTIEPVQSPFIDPFCGIEDWLAMRSLKTEHNTLWPRADL